MREETKAYEALRRKLAKAIHVRRLTRVNPADVGRHVDCEPFPADWDIAAAVLDLGELTDLTCDQKGRESNAWPPEFERVRLSTWGPPVPVKGELEGGFDG